MALGACSDSETAAAGLLATVVDVGKAAWLAAVFAVNAVTLRF